MSTKRVNAFLQLKELDFVEYYGKNVDSIKSTAQEASIILDLAEVQQRGAITVSSPLVFLNQLGST